MYFTLAIILVAVLAVGVAHAVFTQKVFSEQIVDRVKTQKIKKIVSGSVLGAIALLCVLFACFLPYHVDLSYYQKWGDWICANGLSTFYQTFPPDYPPVFLYFCAALSCLSEFTGIQYQIIYRLFFSLVYVASVFVVYAIANKVAYGHKIGIALVYALTPAIVADGSVWGQSDVIVALFAVVLWFFLQSEKWIAFFGTLLAALLIKTQIILFAPVIFIWLIYKMIKNKLYLKFILYAVAFIGLYYLMYLPFGINYIREGDPFFIFDLFLGQVGHYTYYSANAMNFWSALGLNLTEAYPAVIYISYGVVAVLSVILAVAVIRSHSDDKLLVACILQLMIVFFICVSMHERYLLPAIPLMLFLCAKQKNKKLTFYTACIISLQFVNLIFAWIYKANDWYDAIQGIYIILSLSFLVVACLYTVVCTRILRQGKQNDTDQNLKVDKHNTDKNEYSDAEVGNGSGIL